MAPLNLLLDTHVLVWWFANNRNLSASARDAITTSQRVYVSAASAWEISIKVASGKLEFHGDIEVQMRLNNFLPLPVSIFHGITAGRLPLHHKDPFDRILVAQAAVEGLTLLTHDRSLAEYEVPILVV